MVYMAHMKHFLSAAGISLKLEPKKIIQKNSVLIAYVMYHDNEHSVVRFRVLRITKQP
jgi:hypothetical protein